MKVSHPARVIYPEDGITKGDVVGYYEAVAERLMPHVQGRPLTLQRFPKGIGGPGFMQKNAPDHFPASIERIPVPKREGGTTVYPVLHDAADLPYLANQGTVTFHVWSSRLPDLERPDRIIIDLDPPEGELEAVRRAAATVRGILDDLGLPTCPVATGSKGYHLVAPIVPDDDAVQLADRMHAAAIWMASQAPDLLTAEFRIEERKGRVFLDWLRNRPGQTAVAPWSLRARNGAPAAVPLVWDELAATAPDGWTLATIDRRLAEPDPLLDLMATPAVAAPALAALESALTEAGIETEPFDRFRP